MVLITSEIEFHPSFFRIEYVRIFGNFFSRMKLSIFFYFIQTQLKIRKNYNSELGV